MVLLQASDAAERERMDRERDDHQSEDQPDDVIVRRGQQEHAQRNSRKGREDQSAGAPELDPPPILNHDDARHDDRHQDRQRRRDRHGRSQRQERHGHERLAESERRADERGDEDDGHDVQGDRSRWI